MIIVAALVAVVQIVAQRNGVASPISVAGTSVLGFVQNASQSTVNGVRDTAASIAQLPQLQADNQQLSARNERLVQQNAELNEQVSAYQQVTALRPVLATYPNAVTARVIGYPPEDDLRSITINRGSRAGVHKNDGVLAAAGVVGVVQEADPFTSKVLLITDYTSRVPVVVRQGRSWGIARGNLSTVRMEFIAQDAPLRVGDIIVTGEGRTFHSGAVIGTVTKVDRSDASLYQTAVVQPAVDLGALDRVVVVPHAR